MSKVKIETDLFEAQLCVACDKDCSLGSGRFINRTPFFGDDVEGYR